MSDTPCRCIEGLQASVLHSGHCCCFPGTEAPGYPPTPACHPTEWRTRWGHNHPAKPREEDTKC